jgi:thioredoxin reductase
MAITSDSTRKSWNIWGLDEMNAQSIAIIGAGPIGMETALEGLRRGFAVTVYEADRVGGHLTRFGHVPLFTPFGMNSTAMAREALRNAGVSLPGDDALLSAAELVTRYLVPLQRLAELRDSVREGSRVTHVGREGIPKGKGIVAAGDQSRFGTPFLLRIESADGSMRYERADIVIDTSGVYGSPNATGSGGLPALGEEKLGDRIERHIPAIAADTRKRYVGRTVLLVGDGHSAATALTELATAIEGNGGEKGTQIHWVHRERDARRIFAEIQDDALPARRDLAARANAIARTAPWLTHHPGATIVSYEAAPAGKVRASLRLSSGAPLMIEVDRVLALVGYRPDTALYRELQVHLCYASEGPMDLATAILSSSLAAPEKAAECLSQVAHGPESLKTPEPGFFILGGKSYGRNPAFLLTIGHLQIQDLFSKLTSESPARSVGVATA